MSGRLQMYLVVPGVILQPPALSKNPVCVLFIWRAHGVILQLLIPVLKSRLASMETSHSRFGEDPTVALPALPVVAVNCVLPVKQCRYHNGWHLIMHMSHACRVQVKLRQQSTDNVIERIGLGVTIMCRTAVDTNARIYRQCTTAAVTRSIL